MYSKRIKRKIECIQRVVQSGLGFLLEKMRRWLLGISPMKMNEV